MRSYVASLALLLVACSSGLSPGTPDGSAADAAWSWGLGELCGNGIDDDGDGVIDCADLECAAPPLDEHGDFASANRYVFVHGPTSLSAPEMMIRGGESYRFVTDVRGSVRLVVRASDGAVVQAIDYDTFGRVTRDTSPGFQPFGFAGGVYDPDTHLVRFGARDYDAETGRFLTPAPSGFAGSLNAYDYAGADPVNAIDPDGEIVFMLAVTVAYGFAAADSLWQWGMHRVHPFSSAASASSRPAGIGTRTLASPAASREAIEISITVPIGRFTIRRPNGRAYVG